MRNYTNDELRSMIRALQDETDEDLVQERSILQGILDTREADEYAQDKESRRSDSNCNSS